MPDTPYILLVEDNPGDARLTRALLEEGGVLPGRCAWVQTAGAAVDLLKAQPDCEAVLLDLGLPDSQGLETLASIRLLAAHCPILVLTGDDDENTGLQAVAEGAQDFLVKGSFDAGLLRRSLGFAAHRKRAEQALLDRALHDELTGLPKRALLLDRLQEALKCAQRGPQEGALLFIDLDRFKHTNDTHGHAAGDAVLCAVAQRLQASLRASDTSARLGGDEFVVLLPKLGAAQDALTVAHKLVVALSQPLAYGPAQTPLEIGCSIGVVCFKDGGVSAADLMARADAAMYAAKASGRGTVRLLQPESTAGTPCG